MDGERGNSPDLRAELEALRARISALGSGAARAPGPTPVEEVLERVTDGFIALDGVWQFTYVNKKAGEILGRRPPELLGRPLWTELPEGVFQKFIPSYYRSLAEQQPIVQEEQDAASGRWYENRIYPSAEGLSIFFTDITERKLAEQAHARLETLMEGTSDLVGFADAAGRVLHLNPAGRRMLGVPDTGGVPGTIFDFIPERLQRSYQQEWMPAAVKEGVWRGESAFRARDGREVPVSQVLLIHRKADGPVDFVSTIARDISERKQVEARLRGSEARFRTLVENAPEAIVVFDAATGRFTDCNENAVRLLGYSREELLGRRLRDFWPPSQPEGFGPDAVYDLRLQAALDEGWSAAFVWVHRNSGGREFPCDVRLVRLPGEGGPAMVRASVTDISDRIQGTRALQESEARYRTLVENATEAIVVLDLESGRFVEVNENTVRLFGLDRAELAGKGPVDLSPPQQPDGRPSAESAMEKVADAVAGGRPVFEWTHRNARGQDFPCEVRLVRIPRGGSVLIRGSITDISERKRAQEAMEVSEERFRQIAETIHDVFWVSSPALDEILYVTRAFEEIWGRKRNELYRSARVWDDAIHPDDGGAELRVPAAEARGVLDNTYRILRPDGTLRWIHERAFPVLDAQGTVIRRVGIAEDVTQLKEAEAALFESRKQVEEALRRTQDRVVQLEEQVRSRSSFGLFVGKCDAMQEVYRRLRLAGQSDVTVLLTGESGTGKELAARAVHDLGTRKGKAFVAVNCSAIPETLLESELFGHVKGSFTGATRDKMGLFQSAEGGTLFLDEVGDMPASLQVKVLRALQEKEIRRVGDDRTQKVDVRVVAATNRELKELIASGRMREDFYYRIRVFEIRLPALRERREDIPLLVAHFIEENALRSKKKIRGISADALKHLMDHPWPGNIRELRNAVEHAFVTVSGDHLDLADFPASLRPASPAGSPADGAVAEDPEKEQLKDALKKTGGNRARAAKLLGVSRVTLWKRMKKCGLS